MPAATTPTPVEKLWKRYLRTRDVALRNELVINYGALVQTHAARLARKLPAQVTYDEICSAAYGGLIEAVEAYDPAHKTKFETFCQQRIAGAVMDWLRSLDPQSRTVRTFEKRRIEIREDFDSTTGRVPTNAEVADRLGVSLQRYEQLSRLSQLGKEVHFSAMEPQSESRIHGAGHAWDVTDASRTDPTQAISREMLTEHITSQLPNEERLILTLYYFEELTMAEIGQVLNLSESRVSQIHKAILIRLRQRFSRSISEELVA